MCPNGWWGYGNTRKHDYFYNQGVRDNFLSMAQNLAAIKALVQLGLQNTVGTTKTANHSTSNSYTPSIHGQLMVQSQSPVQVPMDPVGNPVTSQCGTEVNSSLQAVCSSKSFEKNYPAYQPPHPTNEHCQDATLLWDKLKPPPKHKINITVWKQTLALAKGPRAQSAISSPASSGLPPNCFPSYPERMRSLLPAPTPRTSASSFGSAIGHPGWEISADSAGALPGGGGGGTQRQEPTCFLCGTRVLKKTHNLAVTQKQTTKLEPAAWCSLTNIYWAPTVCISACGGEVGKGRGWCQLGAVSMTAGMADLATHCWVPSGTRRGREGVPLPGFTIPAGASA